MMQYVLEDVRKEGYKKIMLWVFKDNERARRFYETNDFVTLENEKTNIVPVEIMYVRDL